MIDLIIPLEDSGRPLYEQIYRHIAAAVADGRILPGERLPSTRRLCEGLNVSRSTVQMAYDQLAAEGYILPKPQSGYFAAKLYSCDISELKHKPSAPTGEAFGTRPAHGQGTSERLIDFSPFGIDTSHFPVAVWRRLSREVLSLENNVVFSRGDAQGEPGLRLAVCRYLAQSRGVECIPEQVVIGGGTEFLLAMAHGILPHGAIAMDDPTYTRVSRFFIRLGRRVTTIPIEGGGMPTDTLLKSGADIAFVMPSHHFPTGEVMPVTRRQELLSWASGSAQRYIIEDDYDSEFRYRGRPIPALAGSDMDGRVIYIGTFSKSVAPSLRTGYMVLPMGLLEKYRDISDIYPTPVSRIGQDILERFIADGYFERHLNRMRTIYRQKRKVLLESCRKLGDRFVIHGDSAGLHVRLVTKKAVPETLLVESAGAADIKVYGMSPYYLEKSDVPASVLLGYANLDTDEIMEGIGRLDKAWGF